MTDTPHPGMVPADDRPPFWRRLGDAFARWQTDKIASPAFQRWAARFPLTRPIVRRETERLYDLVSGFVYSQTLLASVELGLLETLRDGPMTAEALAPRLGLAPDRARRLCQAAASVDLLVRRRDETYRLGSLGAAVLGVPGLMDMIRHHAVFYNDLSDPVALLRGETETALSQFWPYVLGKADGPIPADTAATYSHLMATSQHLVAEETLDAVSLDGVRHMIDVGGGTGVFLDHVARRHAAPRLTLFDLPPVVEAARARLADLPHGDRIAVRGGSFVNDPLPEDADTISLIRVLYDHDDPTVIALLRKVRAALPSGGRLVVSEPMSGGAAPSRAGDAYFGFYTLAMTTGRPRSAEQHAALMAMAGFRDIRTVSTRRPFLTGVVEARV